MKILLDTHGLIWLLEGNAALTPAARRIISDAEEVSYSSASVWEIALKWRKGKLNVQPRVAAQAATQMGLRECAITQEAILVSSELASEHGDPFDRLLYAQARCARMRLLTVDEKIPKFGAAVLRAG